MKVLEHISYSFLHLLACPYASWLRYEAALKTPTSPWMALGSAVHYAIEISHEDGDFNVKSAISRFSNEFRRIINDDDVFIGYPQLKKLEADGIEMLERYNVQIQSGALSKSPLALEKEFSIPIAGTFLVGRIDKIEYIEGYGYIVSDFKTGTKKPDDWSLRNNLQLTAYHWACKELYGEYPQKVVWHHMRTGELLESERTERDVENLQEMINNAMTMRQLSMKHRIFHDDVCGHCDYKSRICTDYALEDSLVKKLAEGAVYVDQ